MASNPYKTTGLLGWIDNRFPLTLLWHDHMDRYYAAKNFNFCTCSARSPSSCW